MDIAAWLRSLDLQQYEAAFREHAVDAAILPTLTAEDLKELGVARVGHRRKLLDAIAALRAASPVLHGAANAVTATLRFEPPGAKRENVRPVGIAMTSDGRRAFVGLSRAEVVGVVDVERRQVEAYWKAGKRPWNVAVSRDNARLFVANAQGDDVSILDAGSGRVLGSVKVGRNPHSILVDD